ncbi:unnamed protein product [Orchesella dallaii]|uniref:Harmonin-binding protein USHBP1 PDZ-binding domain-containing protein n=1 Tax=Orchesella dallaii TaxID=48710 RepID=A0ABP1RM90_9HEXA
MKASFTPNGLNGCSSIIASLSPLLGRTFHSQASTTGVEPRIRHLISNLKAERDAVKQTVMELESGSLESLTPSPKPSSPYNNNATWSPADARKMDLETAVLMQELMAMKEERAELRAQQFLLEKEKVSLELRLRSHESQEDAYKARINYLKSEIMDCKSLHSETYQQQERNRNDNINSQQQQNHHHHQQNQTENNGNNFRNLETLNNNNNNQNVNGEREVLLKKRIHELANTLEKVTVSSQVREKQNEEMINELNRANGILMQTLEVAKKKYQNRIKKMEDQILYVSERHAAQLKLFGERLPTIMGKCQD